MYQAIHRGKPKRAIKYLGYTVQEFRDHLERQFVDGMTWDNYDD